MKRIASILAGATSAVLGAKGVAAQRIDTASAGNGGVGSAGANGGAVSLGDINSGGTTGNALGAGNTWGPVRVDGGDAFNSTVVDVASDAGTAIADASGADENLAAILDGVRNRNRNNNNDHNDNDHGGNNNGNNGNFMS